MTDRVNIRGGYNYGNNPVPRHTMDPIVSSIVEHHLVGGAKYQLTEALSLDVLFTYAFKKSRTYDSNFAFPLGLGNNVSSEVGGKDCMFALTYRP